MNIQCTKCDKSFKSNAACGSHFRWAHKRWVKRAPNKTLAPKNTPQTMQPAPPAQPKIRYLKNGVGLRVVIKMGGQDLELRDVDSIEAF